MKTTLFGTIIFWIGLVNSSYSQILELDLGNGYSITSVESWSGITENGTTYRLHDWSYYTGYASLQVLFPATKSSHFGISAGYQHLFWYEYEYIYDRDYGYSYFFDRGVSAWRLMGFTRFNSGASFIDIGLGAYIFDDFTDFASLVSFGHLVRITEEIALPVKLNCNLIADSDAIVVPITLSIGLSYNVKK
jgi:hypothetical protein